MICFTPAEVAGQWNCSPSSVRTSLGKAAERAGVTPHVFQRSAAVWMAEAGHLMGEIANFLGHADDKITQRVYAGFSSVPLR